MRIHHLPEPELEFGGGGKHIDIRFGLMEYGPLIVEHQKSDIMLGIVGTSETVQLFMQWLQSCENGVEGKVSKQQNLYPRFPGFGNEGGLPVKLGTTSSRQRGIDRDEFENFKKYKDHNQIVREAAELIIKEMEYIIGKTSVDVLVCVPPQFFIDLVDEALEDEDNKEIDNSTVKLDFHDYLKAKAMRLMVPIQYIRQSTYDSNTKRASKKADSKKQKRQVQDPATCAWNIYVGIYYKSGATPWRIPSITGDLSTCFVGMSFFETLDKTKLLTSTAQVFNDLGKGLVLRGGTAKLSKDGRQPHLEADDAAALMKLILDAYRDEHHTLPARVVIHKTSKFVEEEIEGISQILKQYHVGQYDLLNLDSSTNSTRLLRTGYYPTLRGTFLELDQKTSILYTFGSVDFYEGYPGPYVPNSLRIRCDRQEQSAIDLAREILALTKMNWHNSRFENSKPITIKAARQVGSILKYFDENESKEFKYFYRFFT